MDQAVDYHTVRALRADSRSFADRKRSQGWLQSERSANSGRRAFRLDLDSGVNLAYCAAHEPLHQASAPNAHRSDTLDGSDLCIKCCEYIFDIPVSYNQLK